MDREAGKLRVINLFAKTTDVYSPQPTSFLKAKTFIIHHFIIDRFSLHNAQANLTLEQMPIQSLSKRGKGTPLWSPESRQGLN